MISLRQRWMLALSALSTHLSGRSHVRLGGVATSSANQVAAATDLFKNWKVRGAEDTEQLLSFLSKEGFRGNPELLTAELALEPSASPRELPIGGLLANDAGLLSLLAGWAFVAGYLTETEAWAYVERLAPEIQSKFESFADFGAAYLMGQALRTGSWNHRQERAQHELLSLVDSPWRTLPWRIDLGRDVVGLEGRNRLVAIDLCAFFGCPTCKELNPVDALVRQLPCRGCGVAFEPASNGWIHVITETMEQVRHMPIGHVHRLHSSGRDYVATSRWMRVAPACLACGADLGHAVMASAIDGVQICGCGAASTNDARDPWIRALHPEIVAVLGERDVGTSARGADHTAFVLGCTSCGAPLRPPIGGRTVTCTHCRKVDELSDEVLRACIPPPPAPRLRLVLADLVEGDCID